MIEHTFVHVPGIGAKTEKRMWQEGVTSLYQIQEQIEEGWDMEEGHSRQQQRMRRIVDESVTALEERDWAFFLKHLPSREHWRVLPCFERPAYLDIETTGLSHFGDHITTIGIYDGQDLHSYIYGRNLDDFADDIMNYDVIITYNGRTFDLPFIRAGLRMKLDMPEIDLRYLLAGQGYKGGLKKIEKDLGLARKGAMADIDGYMAVLLWKEYTDRGNRNALETLVAYNLEDVINLKPLAEKVFNMSLPPAFEHLNLRETTTHPEVPHRVDEELVNRLKGRW